MGGRAAVERRARTERRGAGSAGLADMEVATVFAQSVLRNADGLSPADGSHAAAPLYAAMIAFARIESVNAAHGRAAGDAALAVQAGRMRFAAARLGGRNHCLARLDGSAFLILCAGFEGRAAWQAWAEGLLGELAATVHIAEDSPAISLQPRIVLGRASAGEDAGAFLTLLAQSSTRLRTARGKRLAWAPQNDSRLETGRLEQDLGSAIEGGGISVAFQPQYRCADDRLTGSEALARWFHPDLHEVDAETLMAVAHSADLVPQLSARILREALRATASWPASLRLSVNITAEDLAQPRFDELVLRELEAQQVDPARLTLEITEQVLLADLSAAADCLSRLASTGVRIALDDFGAGFCHFGYLKRLPLHVLKLDRSMLAGVECGGADLAVLRAMVAMGRALGLDVVAEGVESEAQRQLLATEGCASYQGFLKGRPLDAAQFAALAREAVPAD